MDYEAPRLESRGSMERRSKEEARVLRGSNGEKLLLMGRCGRKCKIESDWLWFWLCHFVGRDHEGRDAYSKPNIRSFHFPFDHMTRTNIKVT